MSATNYFLPRAADEADLSPWSPLLATQTRALRTNLFGDAFVVDEAGAVHMLERAACSVERIASSEEDFWREMRDDPQGWQLRPFVDECRHAGKMLAEGECYAFTTPPVLGGDFALDNIWIAPWQEWFSFTADLFQQIKDLPDGATVSFRVTD